MFLFVLIHRYWAFALVLWIRIPPNHSWWKNKQVSSSNRFSFSEKPFFEFTLHPTLWQAAMPMYKGIERSVGWSWPYTHPYLTLHSDVITTVKHDTGRKRKAKESQARRFSVGSELWFRRQRTGTPLTSESSLAVIALSAVCSFNLFLPNWSVIKQILTRYSGGKVASRKII